MAARSANKATGKKRPAAKPKTARAAKPKAKRARSKSAVDPQARIAALEVERDRLAFELDTALERVRVLQEREAHMIRRIDAIAESLHKLLDE